MTQFRLEDLMNLNPSVNIEGRWVPARPINYKYRTFWQKLKEAWTVFIGKSDSFRWPMGQ